MAEPQLFNVVRRRIRTKSRGDTPALQRVGSKYIIRGHYDLLGVSRRATDKEVRRAYRTQALLTHPDRPGGNAKVFQSVLAAFEVLSDPVRRSNYDFDCNAKFCADGQGLGASAQEGVPTPSGEELEWFHACAAARTAIEALRNTDDIPALSGCSALTLLAMQKVLLRDDMLKPMLGESIGRRKTSFKGSVSLFIYGNSYRVSTALPTKSMFSPVYGCLEAYSSVTVSVTQALAWQAALAGLRARAVQRLALDQSFGREDLHEAYEEAPDMYLFFRWKINVNLSHRKRYHLKAKLVNTPSTENLDLAFKHQRDFLELINGGCRTAREGAAQFKRIRKVASDSVNAEKASWAAHRKKILDLVSTEMPRRMAAGEIRTKALQRQVHGLEIRLAEFRERLQAALRPSNMKPPQPDEVHCPTPQQLLSGVASKTVQDIESLTPQPGSRGDMAKVSEEEDVVSMPVKQTNTSQLSHAIALLMLDFLGWPELHQLLSCGLWAKAACEDTLLSRCRNFVYKAGVYVTKTLKKSGKRRAVQDDGLKVLRQAHLAPLFVRMDISQATPYHFCNKLIATISEMINLKYIALPMGGWPSDQTRNNVLKALPEGVMVEYLSRVVTKS